MKKLILISIVVLATLIGYYSLKKHTTHFDATQIAENIKDGDIIFQTSQSPQCEAVRIATNSKFSHCGIIFFKDKKPYVLEAVQPVTITPFNNWIQHGKDNKYLIKRLKNDNILTSQIIAKMMQYGKLQLNKDYDLYFEWSDSKIYCSELVYKMYENGANIKLCSLQKLQSFNLTNPKVKAILAQRYGTKIPLNEDVVAPSQLVASDKLTTIFDNY